MDRLTRLAARAYRRVRGAAPIRWAVRRLSPETRRAVRRKVGAPAGVRRDPDPRAAADAARRAADQAVAAARPPFAPDGSGSDPRMNVIGHFRGESGMAEAARSLVTAAQSAGVRVALVSASPTDAKGTDLRFADAIGTDTPYPINVICVNANETVQLMDDFGPLLTAGRYNIGFWFWELSRLPAAWQGAVDRVDEIWVASRFVAETMAERTSKPVRTVRLAVDATPSRPYRRSEFGLPEDVFVFLFTFNFNSYAARKNPVATIDAFRKAFPEGDRRVALVLKPTNVDRGGERMRQLEAVIAGDDRIHVIDRAMSARRDLRAGERRRQLRLTASQRGLRSRPRRDHVARQARHRNGLLGQPRIHGSDEQPARRLPAHPGRRG